LISSIVAGLNLGGLPVHWEARLPGIGISIGRLLGLVVMLVAAFWLPRRSSVFYSIATSPEVTLSADRRA
jgi:hypothetical protein